MYKYCTNGTWTYEYLSPHCDYYLTTKNRLILFAWDFRETELRTLFVPSHSQFCHWLNQKHNKPNHQPVSCIERRSNHKNSFALEITIHVASSEPQRRKNKLKKWTWFFSRIFLYLWFRLLPSRHPSKDHRYRSCLYTNKELCFLFQPMMIGWTERIPTLSSKLTLSSQLNHQTLTRTWQVMKDPSSTSFEHDLQVSRVSLPTPYRHAPRQIPDDATAHKHQQYLQQEARP